MTEIPSWCLPTSEDHLQPSALKFLNSLDVSSVHPACSNLDGIATTVPSVEMPFTPLQSIVTFICQVVPPLAAMGELWLRLFAGFIAPSVLAYLLILVINNTSHGVNESSPTRFRLTIICGVSSAGAILTDALYVQEYGRSLGAGMLFGILLLIVKVQGMVEQNKLHLAYRLPLTYKVSLIGIVSLVITAIGNDLSGSNSGIDIPDIRPGIYFDQENKAISSLVENWKIKSEVPLNYDKEAGSTQWLITGDSRTGIPFLINPAPSPQYVRRWVKVPEDNEAVAIDVAFPPDGSHSKSSPVFIVLHGLNGGSSEDYIREFVFRETKKGSTVCVMIARGLMDTPVLGENVFHGARITDIAATAKTLKLALGKKQTLAGAGFSMGAIILANYVSRSGINCDLDVAVVISGGLDMRPQEKFFRSMRLWQPMLAETARTILLGKFIDKYQKRLSDEDLLQLLRAPDIYNIDIYGISRYNNFNGVLDYYKSMSALGDSVEIDGNGLLQGRINNVHVPLCVIHALDDPLITWRTLGRPDSVVNSSNGNVVMLLTQGGGKLKAEHT